jgi:hypothetical protein
MEGFKPSRNSTLYYTTSLLASLFIPRNLCRRGRKQRGCSASMALDRQINNRLQFCFFRCSHNIGNPGRFSFASAELPLRWLSINRDCCSPTLGGKYACSCSTVKGFPPRHKTNNNPRAFILFFVSGVLTIKRATAKKRIYRYRNGNSSK